MRLTTQHSELRGFTLVELMVVIAIIGILATLLASALLDARCKSGIDKATAAINTCKSVISTAATVSDVTMCLDKAQMAIDELKATKWWDKGKSSVEAAVTEVNRLIDEAKTRLANNDQERDQLEKAKLKSS